MDSDGETDITVVGTYTDEGGSGLLSYRIDRESKKLARCDTADEENPSYLIVLPSTSIVIAVNEVDDGAAVSYEIDPDTGALSRRDRAATGDTGPCHVAVDPTGEYLVVSHYGGGSVALLPVDEAGNLSDYRDRCRHGGSGPSGERQTAPHPHSAWFVSRDVAYVPDLGVDRLFVYELDRSAEELRPLPSGSVDVRPGAGPRHLAMHSDSSTAYLLNELDSTVTVLDTSNVRSPSVTTTLPTLPDDVAVDDNIAADVHVDPHGVSLVASNRGHDSLVIYDVARDPRQPEPIGHVSTHGEWPRNLAFGPDGDAVFVCNQHSDDVASVSVGRDAEQPVWNGAQSDVDAPACIRFLNDGVARRPTE